MPKPINPKQFWLTVEEIYAKRLNAFISTARRHCYNQDDAIDVVHSALAKSITYFQKNPHRKVREQIVHWLIIKECKKHNKGSIEVPYGSYQDFALREDNP